MVYLELTETKVDEAFDELSKLSVAELRPLYTQDNSNNKVEINGHYSVYNKDNEVVESLVTDKYALVQHADAFGIVLNALKDAGKNDIKFQLSEYRGRAWMNMTFPELKVDDGDAGIELGLQLMNSHRGNALRFSSTRKFYESSIEFFGYRLACNNGMRVRIPLSEVNKALGDIVKKEKVEYSALKLLSQGRILHIGNPKARLGQLEEAIKMMSLSIPTIEQTINKAKSVSINKKQLEQELSKLGFGKRLIKWVSEKTEGYTNWDVYNAITDYSSHQTKSPVTRDWLLERANSLLVTAEVLK